MEFDYFNIRGPPGTTRNDTLCPNKTLIRSRSLDACPDNRAAGCASSWESDLTARKGEPIPAPPAGQQHKRAGTRGRTSPPEPCQWRFFQFPQPFSNGADRPAQPPCPPGRSEEHTSELQSIMRNSVAVFFL